MDVNQALKEMIDAWQDDHLCHAISVAWNIRGWVDRGGFAPVMTERENGIYCVLTQ